MKPLRGKRVGSARSARRIQPGGRVGPAGVSENPPDRGTARPAGARPPPGALPPRRCAATGSGLARKGPGAKVARGSGPELYSALPPRLCRSPPGPRAVSSAPSPLVPSLAAGRGGTGPLAPDACVDWSGLSPVRLRPRRAARAGTALVKQALEVRGEVGHPPDPS